MDVTVAVVSYNVAPLLERCLRSVRAALGEVGGGETVVVDNASHDGSAALVATAHPEARLIANAENRGFGAACNQALAAAQTDTVLFLNPDAEIRPGALRALARRLESAAAVGLVGPRVSYPDGRAQPTRRRFPTVAALLVDATPLEWRGPRWPALGAYYRDGAAPDASREDWLSAACLLGRVDTLRSVGGFDPAFFMYFEEVDLCRRLAARGWETWYEPAAEAAHHGSRSADQNVLARDRHYYRSKYRYAARYFGRTTARLIRLTSTGLFAAELAAQLRRRDAGLIRRYGALLRWHLGPET